MPTPFLTPIQDTLFTPDGQPVNGILHITVPATFTSADGFTILRGATVIYHVVNGIVALNLIPNHH